MIEIGECKKWIKRWNAIDKSLVELHSISRKKKYKWAYLIGNIIHDGRQNERKLRLALSKDYNATVRHKIWVTFSHFVVFAEYILDKEN